MAAAWGFLIQRSKAHGLPGIAQRLMRWGADGEAEIMNARIAIQQIIARALAHRPALILADEPTAALDPDASDTVMRLFLSLAHGTGCGVFLSSHDLDLVDRHGISRLSLVVETHGNRITSRLEGLG